MLKKQGSGKRFIFIVFVICLLGAALWSALNFGSSRQSTALRNITIALPTQVSAGALYVGLDQHIFEKHGLHVVIQPFVLGKQALQSMLAGNADFAILADTPFMFAVTRGEKIATVATIFGSRRTMAVVARKDHGIDDAGDLSEKNIGTTFGTNAQYFVDALLVAHSVPKASVTIVDMKPEALVEAIKSEKLDAVTAWQPDLAKLEEALGDRCVTIYGEDIFVYRFLLVGKQDYLVKHADDVRDTLAAIEEATLYIHEHPAVAQRVIGRSLGMDGALLSKTFDPNDFNLSLDQTLLLALSDETRWAMRQGMVPMAPIPNYLDYLYQEPLESVLPSAVKIIR